VTNAVLFFSVFGVSAGLVLGALAWALKVDAREAAAAVDEDEHARP
jgi:hypothetical protein